MENFISSLSRHFSVGRSKKNEMGATCSLPEVQQKSNHGFGVERCRKEINRKTYTFMGIILKWTLNI
jgi:hypothetical protein